MLTEGVGAGRKWGRKHRKGVMPATCWGRVSSRCPMWLMQLLVPAEAILKNHIESWLGFLLFSSRRISDRKLGSGEED